MFENARSFNQNIGSWDVSSVMDMRKMFEEAKSFNQDIGSWNVSSVIDMSGMFEGTESFNQDIGKWPIKSECLMNDMFHECSITKKSFEGKLYGNKIAEYFKLGNPNEFMIWEPYTRWERRKNAVMFFSSISKINIEEIKKQPKDSVEIKSKYILNTLHSMDDNIYKEIVSFI